jgi:hypothetical protein
MTIFGITSTAILGLVLGIAAPALAQHEQPAEKQDHPKQQESQHEQAKPQQQHAKQPQHQQKAEQTQQQPQHQQKAEQTRQQPQHQQKVGQTHQQPQHAQRQADNGHQQHAQNGGAQYHRTQEQQRVQQSAWQGHRSQHWDTDHRNWQQRGGYHGYRIPDDRFRGYFGEDHGFRIYGLPFLVVGGYPRFQYHGYWLSAVDPWPEYWGDDWYDNDDVYVTYVDNGYYLYNRRYPDVGIAISISI